MHDNTPIHRQWLLLKSLSARRHGLTIREMAADAGVDAKTIRRDLDLFRDLGFRLEETTGEFGRKTWALKSPCDQPPLSFRFDEALALYLSSRLLEPLAGTLFWDATQSVFRKTRATLGEPALAYAERMSCFFHPPTVGLGDYSRKAKLLDELTMAIVESHAAQAY